MVALVEKQRERVNFFKFTKLSFSGRGQTIVIVTVGF